MGLLKGLKILDFSTLLPGPFATMMLADLGAEVLHLQRPAEDEGTRIIDHYLQRNKKQVTADLKDPKMVERVKELVKEYDIVLEQFRPGVMDRLGLGYEDLKKVNPKLIYCSITGYGQTGPYKDRAGHDINYISTAGISGISGTVDGGPPNLGTQIADIAGGSLHSVVAILAAYIHRERTGEGQALDISMTDASMTLSAVSSPLYFLQGYEPKPENFHLNGGIFYGYYKTKDGRFFSVGSLEPKFRVGLCKDIGREDAIEFCLSEKPEDVKKFKEIVQEEFSKKTFAEWKEIFANSDNCVEPVLTFEEAMNHPNTFAREMVVEVPTIDGKVQKQIAHPIKSNIWKPEYKHSGLAPNHNNKEIFGEE